MANRARTAFCSSPRGDPKLATVRHGQADWNGWYQAGNGSRYDPINKANRRLASFALAPGDAQIRLEGLPMTPPDVKAGSFEVWAFHFWSPEVERARECRP